MIKKYLHQETLIYWLMTCKKLWNAICCVSFPKSMIKCHSNILDLHLSPCKKKRKEKRFIYFVMKIPWLHDRKSQICFYDEKLWIIFLIENTDLVLWCKKEWIL